MSTRSRRAIVAVAGALAISGGLATAAGADPAHAKPPAGTCPNDRYTLVEAIGSTAALVDQNKDGYVCRMDYPPTSQNPNGQNNIIDDVSHPQNG